MTGAPPTAIPRIEDIDVEWLLRHMRDHQHGYRITVDLWVNLSLPGGDVTVSRKAHLTPDEVLGVLAAREIADHG